MDSRLVGFATEDTKYSNLPDNQENERKRFGNPRCHDTDSASGLDEHVIKIFVSSTPEVLKPK